jgi:hypothetical protein
VLDFVAEDFDPVVLAAFPHRECGLEEKGIVERAERDGDEVVELVVELALDLVIDVGAALGSEVERRAVAAVGDLDEGVRPALDRRLPLRPPRLDRERAARALLAIEAMADRDSDGLAGDTDPKLAAATGSGSTR